MFNIVHISLKISGNIFFPKNLSKVCPPLAPPWRRHWPQLLPEVAFHCNSMINAAIKISPFMLTYGRQPRSPIDLWCERLRTSEQNSHGEYLETLMKKQSELQIIALENTRQSKEKVRDRYNEGKRESTIRTGDQVLLRNNARKDSLEPRFIGPYLVLYHKGSIVKLNLNSRHKWVHLDRCKRFGGEVEQIIALPQDSSGRRREENEHPRSETTHEESKDNLEDAHLHGGEEITPLNDVIGEQLANEEDARNGERQERRYPSRIRRPKEYYGDFIRWDNITPGFREKTTLRPEGTSKTGGDVK